MNLIGTLEIGEEYGVCPLLFRGLLFCFGGGAPTCKMTPICKPTSTSKPALPTNHPFCRVGGVFNSYVFQLALLSSHIKTRLVQYHQQIQINES
jgi:hypothetical protein